MGATLPARREFYFGREETKSRIRSKSAAPSPENSGSPGYSGAMSQKRMRAWAAGLTDPELEHEVAQFIRLLELSGFENLKELLDLVHSTGEVPTGLAASDFTKGAALLEERSRRRPGSAWQLMDQMPRGGLAGGPSAPRQG